MDKDKKPGKPRKNWRRTAEKLQERLRTTQKILRDKEWNMRHYCERLAAIARIELAAQEGDTVWDELPLSFQRNARTEWENKK